MIRIKDFWKNIDSTVQEYLSMRYYGITRCLLNDEQILHISIEELKAIEKVTNKQEV